MGARTVGAQNFALFFFLLPPQFFILFSLSFGLFRGNLVLFEAPGRSNVHVWSSRAVVCEPRRPGLVGPPGFHTTAREPKRAHLRVPVFKNTTKIQRKGPTREGEKNKNCGGRGKKRAKFWAVRRRGVRRRGSGGEALNTPTQQHRNKQHRTLSHTKTNHNNTHKKRIGQKWIGQNWIGQNWQTTNH